MRCENPHCQNEVPAGWEGGMCVNCLHRIEQQETIDRDMRLAEELSMSDPPPGYHDTPNPHEEFGFDYPWEMQ